MQYLVRVLEIISNRAENLKEEVPSSLLHYVMEQIPF